MSVPISTYIEEVNKSIANLELGSKPTELYDPIRYILDLGGKRARAILTIIGYSLYKNDLNEILPAAKAIEVFHNFTLMHDDLMDNAPLRRGQTTVHEKWNPNVAILSGDTMLVKVYDQLLELDHALLPEILKEFNKIAIEVCEGQQFDMNYETVDQVSESSYLEMIRLKTAVLLGYSLKLGAKIGGASQKDQDTLYQIGESMGLAFQLRDDYLDVFGDPEKFGKQMGGDIVSNKKTYLLIKAKEMAEGTVLDTLTEWIAKTEFDTKEKVTAITQIYRKLGLDDLLDQRVIIYTEQVKDGMNSLSIPENRKTQLQEYINQLIARDR